MNYRSLKLGCLAALLICRSQDCLGEKWMDLSGIKNQPQSTFESTFDKWVKATTQSIFRDHENHKFTKTQLDATLAKNATDAVGFELLDRTMNYSNDEAINNMALNFAQREIQKSKLVRSFRGGIDFKFDVKDTTTTSRDENRQVQDNVKYDLKLIAIEPSSTQRLRAALPNNQDFSLVDSAPKAHVQWTIKPIEKSAPTRYTVSLPQPQTKTTDNSRLSKLWSSLTSTEISGNIKPHDTNTEKAPNQLPPQLITLSQDKGIYSLQIVTDENLSTQSMQHVINLDVGTANYRQEYNTDWDLQKTSLLNITEFNNIHANLYHLVNEKRYQSELVYRIGPSSWSLKSDTHTDTTFKDLNHETHSYQLGYATNF